MASWFQPALVFLEMLVRPQPGERVRLLDGGAVAAGADGAVADDPGRAAGVQVGVFAEPDGGNVDAVHLRWFYITSPRMTVLVRVDDDGIIRGGPPIVRRFVGQDVLRLRKWLERGPWDRSAVSWRTLSPDASAHG